MAVFELANISQNLTQKSLKPPFLLGFMQALALTKELKCDNIDSCVPQPPPGGGVRQLA